MSSASLTRALGAFGMLGTLACTPLLGLDHEYYVGASGAGGGSAHAGSGGMALAGGAPSGSAGGGGQSASALPVGKLVYHSYTGYEASDSEMYIVDLPEGTRSVELGAAFGICDPTAGNFSPDGTHLAVTARPKPGAACPIGMNRADLEVYLLDLTTLASASPKAFRVTNNTLPDEDPQFAPASDYLLLKHDGHLAKWTLGSEPLSVCSANTPGSFCYTSTGAEESKPVISPDEATICYYERSAAAADVFCFDAAQGAAGKDITAISVPAAAHANLSESRPMIAGAALYYVRWFSPSDQVDRIFRKPLNALNSAETPAAFQHNGSEQAYDYSDPCGLTGDLLVFASDATGAGKHDLFYGNFSSGDLQPFNIPNLNSAKEELGPAFWPSP